MTTVVREAFDRHCETRYQELTADQLQNLFVYIYTYVSEENVEDIPDNIDTYGYRKAFLEMKASLYDVVSDEDVFICDHCNRECEEYEIIYSSVPSSNKYGCTECSSLCVSCDSVIHHDKEKSYYHPDGVVCEGCKKNG